MIRTPNHYPAGTPDSSDSHKNLHPISHQFPMISLMPTPRLPSLTAFLPALWLSVVAGAASPSVEDRVHDLLGRMTLEEKVGQLVQYSAREDMTGPAAASSVAPQLGAGGIGSMLNVHGAAETRKWQKRAIESSRLHIPLLFGLDVIHGYRTTFPIPLATAASWDLARIEGAERIAATEAAAAGIHWTFAPMVDISRDPRWGRIAEGAGEDPFLGSAIARARVRGFQTDNLGARGTILACAKHFAAYGAAQAGRDYFTTDVTERVLREVYLPPFRAALEAGVATFMAGFNDLDGTPCSSNAFLLNRLLRGEWGFRGFVVSDWAAIDELVAHGSAADLRDASRQAFLAGLDMDMESYGYEKHLAALVRAGVVPAARLDAAVSAVLAAKFRLGLFDDPYRYCDEANEKSTLLAPAHLAAARDLARRSCVLLKNNGILPLSTGRLTVALVGPLADSPADQLGCWQGLGRTEEAVSVRSALAEIFPGTRLRYAAGCQTTGTDTSGFAAARAAASEADVIIAALGESASQTGEATSRTSLDLSGPQLALLRELRNTGKPIVLLLMAGRPLLLESVEPLVDAILVGWHPGTMGGPAIADVLTGAYNPAGRLPITWPRSVGQIPLFYAHKISGRPTPQHKDEPYYTRYIDSPNTPLYPFGFGLSYTTFAFDQLRLSAPALRAGGAPLTVTVRVRNTGQRAGEEVVQLYVRDRVGSVTRPVRELKGFAKIGLAAGESRNVDFPLTAADLAFWRADMTFGPEPGDFDVFVGDDSTAVLSAPFTFDAAQ
jgi:beta-glucosidase